MDAFFVRHDVMSMIADEAKKTTATIVTELITNRIENNNEDIIQIGFTSTKEAIKATISQLVKEALINVVQQAGSDAPMVCNIEKMAQSDLSLEAFA